MTEYSSFELQEYDYLQEEWVKEADFPADSRAEGNAYYAVESYHACRRGPLRLLKDGHVVLSDNPQTFYDQEDW